MSFFIQQATLVLSILAAVGAALNPIHSQANETISPGCQRACAQLTKDFGPLLHYPNNDNFTIWDGKQQEVTPACRVEATSATNVSNILQTLVASWCHFSVKGGGHSREAGDSNSIRGVTIDLGRLRGVEVAPGSASARIGGGANLGQTFTALQAHNLSFAGGRVGSVGVGGFVLGGGTSPFANKHGWALDNIYEYKIVLANGTITTASENHNPNLYFAFRGGSNNFGTVTSFTVRTFAATSVYCGAFVYNDNQTETVLDAVYDLFTNPERADDPDVGFDMYYQYNQAADRYALAGTQYYGSPVEQPAVFDEFREIPATSSSISIQPLSRLIGSGGPQGRGTVRHVFGTLTTRPSRTFLSQALAIFKEEVSAVKTVQGLAPNLICYVLPRRAIDLMAQRGGNSLGISNDGPLIIWLISSGWTNAAGDTVINKMTANVADRMEKVAGSLKVDHPYKCVNYASAAQAPGIFKGYGEKNVRKLIKIQKSADPDGIFTSKGLWKGFMKLT